MADRSTRSSTRPQKPPPSRNQSLQSLPPLQQSTRVTRSRSHDISDADAREPAPSRKRRKAAHDEENVANSSAQANRVARRGARSKVLQGNSLQAHLALSDLGRRAVFPSAQDHHDPSLFGAIRALPMSSSLLRPGF